MRSVWPSVSLIERVAPSHLFEDSLWYYVQSANIRRGVGYINIGEQFPVLTGHTARSHLEATAYWPPLFSTFLAGITTVFGNSVRTAEEGGLVTGGATILVSALLARSIGGIRLGLLSALLVALQPVP